MTHASDIIAPSSTNTIRRDVEQYLEGKNLKDTEMFEHYDEALRAVWPQLFISHPSAAIFLSISLFIEIAQDKGFKVSPEFLRRMKEDDEI